MNHRSDIDRTLHVWMADGPATIPDRVVEGVAARIGVQRQRRAWPLSGRTTVNTQIKLVAALAAVLVVAVVGYNVLPGIAGPGTPSAPPTAAPTPSAQPSAPPTAAPSAAPTSSAIWPTWYPAGAIRDATGAGLLAAGTHATRVFSPGFTLSAPHGWVNANDERSFFSLFPDTPANAAKYTSSEAFAHEIFMGPHSSPWFTCESLESNRGATAADMVNAMSANEVLALSGLVDVTIGGLTGKRVDIQRNPDWTGTCPGEPGTAGFDPAEERTRAIFLDVPGRGVLIVFLYSMISIDHEAFLADAMPIVESFSFDLAQ